VAHLESMHRGANNFQLQASPQVVGFLTCIEVSCQDLTRCLSVGSLNHFVRDVLTLASLHMLRGKDPCHKRPTRGNSDDMDMFGGMVHGNATKIVTLVINRGLSGVCKCDSFPRFYHQGAAYVLERCEPSLAKRTGGM
jgi:hypothetical protein